MAFAGSIAPRRKTTTYGKHSRRLISALSSATEIDFAQDAGASMSDTKGTIWHWQGDGRTASSNLLYGHNGFELQPQKPTCQKLPPRAKPIDQHRSSTGSNGSPKDDSLYDVPLSDDALEQVTSAARKRRKVVPRKVIPDKQPPVYDDESLQRHIAAEARRGEGQILHLPNNTSALQGSDSKRSIIKSQAAARASPSKVMSETSENSAVDPKYNGSDATAVVQQSGPLIARKQPEGLLSAEIMSYGVRSHEMDAAKTIARPSTPGTVFDRVSPYEATSDLKSPFTSRKSVHQPSTPPRLTGAAGAINTPRQRELWNRLLVDNAPIASTSSLDLPNPIVSEKKSGGSHRYRKSREVSLRPRQKSAVLKTRPKRIVDTLHQSDQDRNHSSGDCDETRGSSSSDNKSEYTHSEASAADGAVIVQSSTSSDSQTLVSQIQDRSANASQTIPTVYRGALKATYACQRSYLTDNDLEEAAMVSLPVPPEPKNGKESGRRRLRDRVLKTPSMNSLEEFGDLADSQGGTIRSIHELREAGGNVRLVSELETIMDDIGDHQLASTSIRRSKLIDLVTKLQEPANCRLFVDQGLESRLIADMGSGNDLITSGLLVAALLQLMSLSSSTLLWKQIGDVRVVRSLVNLLGSGQDLLSHAKLRGNNMSKAVQANLKSLCSALQKSAVWKVGKPSVLSCHVLSLQCLEHLVRQAREAGSLSEILSAHAIRRVVATSVPFFSTLPPQPGEISVVCLELAVSILESCTISNAAECQASLWAGETLERVIRLLPLLSLWKGEECGTSRTLTLRLYLNLTNNSPGLCEDFATPEVIHALFRIVMVHFEQLADSTLDFDKTLLLDDLILSLGSLINLADLSRIARQLVMDLDYGGQSYMDILLELFMNKSKNAAEVASLEETSSNVAFGWMSVLLSWLCLNAAIKARVSDRLPGNSLKRLLDAVEEFLRYHRRVDQVILRDDGEDDARASFVSRLQSHVDELKKAEGLSGTLYEIASFENRGRIDTSI